MVLWGGRGPGTQTVSEQAFGLAGRREVVDWPVGDARGRAAGEPGGHGRKSLAVRRGSRSLTLMAANDRPQLDHHPERPHATPLDAASVEAVARRVVELIRSEGGSPIPHGLVDAATLAVELGVERSWVYAHRDELGAVQLGAAQGRVWLSTWRRPGRCSPVLAAKGHTSRNHPRRQAVRFVLGDGEWATARHSCPSRALDADRSRESGGTKGWLTRPLCHRLSLDPGGANGQQWAVEPRDPAPAQPAGSSKAQ